MPGVVERLENFLSEEQVEYEALLHRRDVTALEAAHDTHSREHSFAKTVLIWADGRIIMMVLPADSTAALGRVKESLLAREVRLAKEEETRGLFPDCEVGAEPPFGNLYDLPTYISPSLAENPEITFNAGSHDHAVRMSFEDYERIVRPRRLVISKRD